MVNHFEKFSVILLICQNNLKYRDCASLFKLAHHNACKNLQLQYSRLSL